MWLIPTLLATLATLSGSTSAFDINCNSNYASYYGQSNSDKKGLLGEHCKDSTEDVIVLAFMNSFPNTILDFADVCDTKFEGSKLLHCPDMATDIKYCQSQGKAVILSMGGADGEYGFSGDAEATKFADTVWNMLFKGTSDQRPFDDAVLDGIDLDIESGSPDGYVAFIEQLRTHFTADTSKQYYITGAPQCPFPDEFLGTALDGAWFDMVFVQFYNNNCGMNAYPKEFNYDEWDKWAKTKSVNKDVKLFLGAPGSSSAAGTGYVDSKTLSSIYNDVRSKYTNLGGIMTWDIGSARGSGLAKSIRATLDSGGTCDNNGGGSAINVINELQSEGNSDSAKAHSIESDSATEGGGDSETMHGHGEKSDSETGDSVNSKSKHGHNGKSDLATGDSEDPETGHSGKSDSATDDGENSKSKHGHGRMSDSATDNSEDSETIHGHDGNSDSITDSNESSTTDGDGDLVSSPPHNEENTDTASDSEDPNSSIPSNCPVDGAPCSGNQLGCNGEQLAICANNVWYVAPCAPGTYCNFNNDFIICDWRIDQATNTCAVSGGT